MPNSDFNVEYPKTKVWDVPLDSTDMFTHKRVNQFVTDYSKFKKSELAETPDNPSVYSYYHFVPSPEAIHAVNLGSLKSSLCMSASDKTACLLQPYASSSAVTVAGLDPHMNTPDAHKLNLAKDYDAYLSKLTLVPKNAPLSSTIDISDLIVKNFQWSNIGNFDRFVDSFPTQSGATVAPAAGATQSYAIEVFGYLKFPSMENYSISFATDSRDSQSTFLIWIGDVALFEYTATNTSLSGMTSASTSVRVTDMRYMPIRIQLYCQPTTGQPRKTKEDVLSRLQMSNQNKVAVPVTLWVNDNVGGFFYPPLYAAFTSQTQNSYMTGQFYCYTNFGPMSSASDAANLIAFYVAILTNKREIANGKHDRDADGVQEVGTLPSLQITESTPTFFTQNNPDNPSSLPNVFSIYRLSVDSRYDHTYQIRTTGKGPYQMVQMSDALFHSASSYTDFHGYYPTKPTNIQQRTAEECKKACNASATCGHYYTYLSNGSSQCVLGTDSNPPLYNQVRSDSNMEVGSGTLSLRNKQLIDDVKGCAMNQQKIVPPILNVDDYTSNFKYSNYDISSANITDINQVGICGSPEYNNYLKVAKDILYSTHEYRNDGAWKHDNGAFSRKETPPLGVVESMATRNSNATSDTDQSIRSGLNNHEIVRQKMIGINRRDQDLRKNIREYSGLRDVMMADDRYDQNGNILLYLRQKPPPSLTQLNSSDSKLLSDQQTILFYTGLITAASLIVLAVTMGSE
jgi:hypothetical protein